MLDTKLSRLNAWGWSLALFALTLTVLVSIPIGSWSLEAIDTTSFREWRIVLVWLLALPGFGLALLVYWGGARVLQWLGIALVRGGLRESAERVPSMERNSMTDSSLFQRTTHESSGRSAILDELDGSVWLYLTPSGSDRPERDCWLANTVEDDQHRDMDHYRSQGVPPPAFPGVITPGAVVVSPATRTWALRWSPDGEAVAAFCDGEVRGFICGSASESRAFHLREDGPWGSAWDASAFERRFAS